MQQQTIDPTSEAVAQAKCDVERHSERLLHLFSFVPDDKLTWAPSLTSKSALRIVTHCALSSRSFAGILTGTLPPSMPSPEEFFLNLHQAEHQITTRESAVALVKETTSQLCKALDTVNAANLHAPCNSPFGLLPRQFWMSQSSEHLVGHTGQLAYLQTIWADLDNHMG